MFFIEITRRLIEEKDIRKVIDLVNRIESSLAFTLKYLPAGDEGLEHVNEKARVIFRIAFAHAYRIGGLDMFVRNFRYRSDMHMYYHCGLTASAIKKVGEPT